MGDLSARQARSSLGGKVYYNILMKYAGVYRGLRVVLWIYSMSGIVLWIYSMSGTASAIAFFGLDFIFCFCNNSINKTVFVSATLTFSGITVHPPCRALGVMFLVIGGFSRGTGPARRIAAGRRTGQRFADRSMPLCDPNSTTHAAQS